MRLKLPNLDLSEHSWSRDDFVRDHLSKSQPVVISGMASQALQQWDQESLLRRNGEQLVDVEYYPLGSRGDAFTYRQMTLQDYDHLVQSSEEQQKKYYLAEKPIDQIFPHSADDYEMPLVIPGHGNPRTMGFYGYNTFSTCHYHKLTTQAILTQVIGTKRLLLFPPTDARHLDLTPWYGLRPNHSRIPFDEFDWEELSVRFPDLAKTTAYEVELQPGESLYIPDHWLHTAEGIGCSLSITTFWDDDFRLAYSPGVYRDRLATVSKTILRTGARVGTSIGLQPTLVKVAAMLGVIRDSEVEAVGEYIAEHGVTPPSQLPQAETDQTQESIRS